MSIYEFDPEDAERFAVSVGAKTKMRMGQMEFLFCPYCHGGKKDKYTFSISMKTGQFECKRASCGMRGNMITLSRDFSDRFELSNDVTRYFNTDGFNSHFKRFKDAHRKIESKGAAVEYLKSRGISEEICRKYELTIKNDTENVLVFPFKNESGELKFIKYRNINYKKGETPGNKEWCESNCMPILFGMNHCEDFGTLVITEGQMDSLSLAEAGIANAVSVPTGANGFTWFPHCYDWLQKFNEIVVFGDCENGKVTLADELALRFQKRVRIVKIADYRGYKDANDILINCGKEALKTAVNNAEAPTNGKLAKLSGVEKMDIEKIEAISTGLPSVDHILSGGFHMGQLVILTGKRGDGKSTMMSQFICEALKQGYKCMAYSGELVDFYFKAWIDRQIYGKDNLQQSEVDAINRWYDDKMYLYCNNTLHEDKPQSEMERLLETIEEAVTRYGIKFFAIDNLMTAIEAGSFEKIYDVQSKFVGKLAEMCRTYQVVIILVAHPRKEMFNNGDENDSISGSADITNKADIVMKYQRPKVEKGIDPANLPPRQLAVIKNRLTGKITGQNPIGLYFEEHSKRISEKPDWFGWSYMNPDEFNQLEVDTEAPFD